MVWPSTQAQAATPQFTGLAAKCGTVSNAVGHIDAGMTRMRPTDGVQKL
jgi:hypothetical protein